MVDAALQRILTSATFRRSERHRQFLRHVVRATLDGRFAELKEVVIGIEVFGRTVADYDPRHDPIVRVEAGRVREKLARYYAMEGVGDPFELQIPIGGYLPLMSQRRETPRVGRNLGSLAVLPFDSLSGDADDTVFCSGLVNQLVDVLGRVPGLRVIGQLSAAKARAAKDGYPALGKLLGATSVIGGSVQRSGARYRCLVQRFRTRDGQCLWSQRFEGSLDEHLDVFALQDRISDAVVQAVTAPESPAPATLALRRGAASSEVRDLFERGRYLGNRYGIEDSRKAIALLSRAVALDPTFARAHAQLAACQVKLAMLTALPVAAAMEDIERNATRALQLDPSNGEARSILAYIAARVDHDWARGERLYRAALHLAPSSSTTHSSFGSSLVYLGRYVEGVQHGRIALDLDPLNLTIRADYALSLSFARDFDMAVKEFAAILEIESDHLFSIVMLGMTRTWMGDHAAALPYFERAAAVAPLHPVPGFCKALSLGAHGRIHEGRSFLAAHVERLVVPHARYNRAMAEAYLGDRNAILESLHGAAEANENVMNSFAVDPSFDDHREDPDFVAVREALRLPQVSPSPFMKPPAGG